MNIFILSLLLITMTNAYIKLPFRNFKQKRLCESSEELWDHGEVAWDHNFDSMNVTTPTNTSKKIYSSNIIDQHMLAMLFI